MQPAHSDKEFPGAAYRRGQDGDARRGTVYGYRTAQEYNRIKAAATEAEEGRKVVLRYYAKKLQNDSKILEFVVINGHLDPGMKVISRIPKTTGMITVAGDSVLGTIRQAGTEVFQEWPRFEKDGQYVFLAPDSYDGGPISWFHRADLGDEAMVYESDKRFLFLSETLAETL